MSFFLAVDSGGTKTDYLLADETQELARVRTGTIKRMRTDAESASRQLDEALAELSNRTGVSMASVTRTCIGTAGESVALVTGWLRQAFSTRVAGALLILSDVEIALDAAFPGKPGVLVMAGTGSNVAGRTTAKSGETLLLRAGGYGPVLADQGSGYRIGLESLRAIFLARDEGRPTQLEDAVLAFWQLASPAELIGYANALPAPDFASLASVVQQCSERGDPSATAVLRRQGEELAYLVRLVIRRLRLAANKEDWTPSLACTGSILENIPLVRQSLVASVEQEFPQVHTLEQTVDPLEGALWRARTGNQG